jgi:hypothetical protein
MKKGSNITHIANNEYTGGSAACAMNHTTIIELVSEYLLYLQEIYVI